MPSLADFLSGFNQNFAQGISLGNTLRNSESARQTQALNQKVAEQQLFRDQLVAQREEEEIESFGALIKDISENNPAEQGQQQINSVLTGARTIAENPDNKGRVTQFKQIQSKLAESFGEEFAEILRAGLADQEPENRADFVNALEAMITENPDITPEQIKEKLSNVDEFLSLSTELGVNKQNKKTTDPLTVEKAQLRARINKNLAARERLVNAIPHYSGDRLEKLKTLISEIEDTIKFDEERITGISKETERDIGGTVLSHGGKNFVLDKDNLQLVEVPGAGGAVKGAGATTIVNHLSKETEKTLGKGTGERINSIIDSGLKSVVTTDNARQLGALLKEGVDTGTLQNTFVSLKGIAEDLGLDIDSLLGKANLKSDSGLAGQEEFDRLSKLIIIDGFEKFKGNLNAKEVQIAENAFANLGRSEEANIDAVAALLATSEIARQRAAQAVDVDAAKNPNAAAAALIKDMLKNDSSEFSRLKREFAADIRSENTELPEGVPEGSQPIGQLNGQTVYETPDGRKVVVDNAN